VVRCNIECPCAYVFGYVPIGVDVCSVGCVCPLQVWLPALLRTIDVLQGLGVRSTDLFVSIYESGSTDATPKLLASLRWALIAENAPSGEPC
jgi:hypothetical protein